jgi:hypothetical protein
MEKSNFNRILFPPSLWWSFFLSLFNPPFSSRPCTHSFPIRHPLTHSLSYVQIPPSLLATAMAHKKSMRAFSLLCTSARYKKRGFYKMKWYSSEEREREQNHQKLFLSNFLCVSFCCSWNDKWWKDIDMKKVSFVVRGLNTHGWMIAKWEKSWKSPAREIRAREREGEEEWIFLVRVLRSYATFISTDCSQLLHGNDHESMKTENLRPLLHTSGRCVWVNWKNERFQSLDWIIAIFCIFSTSVKKVPMYEKGAHNWENSAQCNKP